MKQLKDIAHYVTEKVEVASLSSGNYISTENMLKNKQGVTFDASLPDAAKVTKFSVGDVLVSNIRPYFKKIYQADRNGGCSNDVIVFRTNDDNVYRQSFLYYVLSQDYFFDYMNAGSNGTKMPRGNKKLIPLFPVPDFTIAEQDKIVDLLSDYDKLIANCQRKIALLEEAAQRTYNEWFVHMRFPGHEQAIFIDGLPEGWERTNINNMLTFHRGYDLTHNEMNDGKFPVVGSTSIIGYHNQYKIKGPGIVTGRSGSLGQYQFIWENFWPHNTSLYISDYKGHDIFFIYYLLRTVDFTRLNSGGAIPSLNRNTLSNVDVVEPPKELQYKYSQITKPFVENLRSLQKQIVKLREARYLLLPRLISREITI